jgi:hypothetical protein
MSAPPQAITPNPHINLLNVYTSIQIANKKWFQPNKKRSARVITHRHSLFAVSSSLDVPKDGSVSIKTCKAI